MRPVKGHLITKINIGTLFYQKLGAKYFLINNFLKKKYFLRKNVKNCFGDMFDNFLGKEGVLPRKLINLFFFTN